jgi:hypothetical protein
VVYPLDDADYFVKHIVVPAFLRLTADALIVLAGLVIGRTFVLHATLDVVVVRLEAVGPVYPLDDSDNFVKHIPFPSPSTL